ncbi:MAG: phosphoglycolate phosphatase [Syntrophus sp. (in: bacteria)]|nr:phosphoglycolate phosphatase [Syntrophus sp. (in: bacteria)]
MPVKLIIFDLDGTLIDSIHDIANALNHTFEPYGIPTLTPQEVAGMVGGGPSKLVDNVLEKHNVTVDKERLIKELVEYYSSHYMDYTLPYPDTIETLKALKGYKKVIVTNKPERPSLKTLDGLGLTQYFDMVVCADTLPERKPSPAPVFHVLSRLNVQPEHAIIVGDSRIDMDTGKASSVKTVAVTYGYGPAGFEKDGDFVISRLSELIDIVKSIE